MKKSKRQYEAEIAKMNDALAKLIAVRDSMIATYEAAPNEDFGDAINNVHDAIKNTEEAIEDTERACRRRNWTEAEWSSYRLIAENID